MSYVISKMSIQHMQCTVAWPEENKGGFYYNKPKAKIKGMHAEFRNLW